MICTLEELIIVVFCLDMNYYHTLSLVDKLASQEEVSAENIGLGKIVTDVLSQIYIICWFTYSNKLSLFLFYFLNIEARCPYQDQQLPPPNHQQQAHTMA